MSPESLRLALAGIAGWVAVLSWGTYPRAETPVIPGGAARPEPTARAPATTEEWEAQAPSVRARLRQELGRLPPAFAPQARVVGRGARDGYVQQDLQLENGAGRLVSGRALVPHGHVGRGPAVLYLDDPAAAAEDFAPGEELARHGFLVFAFDAREGACVGAVRDDLLAMHYVLNRRDVDPERVAVWGAGQGGARATWLAALEPQVAMSISLCPALEPGMSSESVPPGQLLGLIAPRLQLVLAGARQPGFPAEQARAAFAAGRQYYRLYDLPELFRAAVLPEAGRQPTERMCREACAWLAEEL